VKSTIALLCLAFCASLSAAGPDVVAFANRSLWPETLDSSMSFDRASRAEILVFSAMLDEAAELDHAALLAQLHTRQLNSISVDLVRNRLSANLFANWQAASASCSDRAEQFCYKINSTVELVAAGKELAKTLPAPYRGWLENARKFHADYVRELLRLAALFPNTSSEIGTFSPLERTGFELADRHFLLTFDDGPSERNGNTDSLLAALPKSGPHAMFYMLGERLQARLLQDDPKALANLFQGHCAAMHGWRHQSHAKWEKWQSSVTDTRDLVKITFPGQYRPWFRPPFGQRREDSGEFFAKSGVQVALWNIDSQDWNNRMGGAAAAQRVLTLMLLWRRGVILFHDIHPKALTAVPWLIEQTRHSGVIWADCREY
jgi:peptidoglycan/xylan/chitin deacetylase (PgdA/CDA1 family)